MKKFIKIPLSLLVFGTLLIFQNCKDKDKPEEPPIAKFTFTSDNGFEAPSTITFANTSTNATTYEWDFGDGTATVTTENPVHVFENTGSYTVTLTAKKGSKTNSSTATITIVDPTPVASFTYESNNNFITPSEITFTNTSTSAVGYEWDFGDGSDPVTDENPVHTFAATGDYTVTLKAINGAKSDTETVSISITPADPTADFTFVSNNDFHTPSVITFTNTSTSAMSYEWDFGDGSATSTEENPVHTYTTTGSYTVTLTATNETLSDEKTATIVITPFQPVANFTHTSNNGYTAPSNITFTNTSTNAASVVWDFGDESATSTEGNPVHSYATPGTYTVTLTATNETLTDVETKTITISEMAYTGVYQLVSAIISEDVIIDGELYQAGRDVTADAQTLFDVVSCGNPANRAMDLKFTGDLAFVCIGPNNETSAGSWSGNASTKIIDITFTSPPYPTLFIISIENATLSGNTLTGEMNETGLPGVLFGLSGTIYVSLDLEFEKQ